MKDKQISSYATKKDFDYLNKVAQYAEYKGHMMTIISGGSEFDFVAANCGCIEKMVDDGKDLNLIYGSYTLLCKACLIGTDMMKFLIDKGADVNAPMKGKYTPLHLACMIEDNIDEVKLLLDCGADVTLCDIKGRTASQLAIQIGNKEAAKLIKEKEKEAIIEKVDSTLVKKRMLRSR